MPKIPLVEPTGPAQSAGSTVRADTNLYNAVAQAGQNLGNAVAGIGGQLQDFAFRKQRAVNAGQMIDANTRMQTGFEDFALSLQDPNNTENGDETTFAARWDSKRRDILDDIKGQNYAPDVLRDLGAHLRQWDAESGVKVRALVNRKSVEKAVATYQTAYDAALRRMDPDGAIKLVSDGESRGLFNPEHAEQLKASAPRKVDHYSASQLIQTDPIAAEHFLNDRGEDGSPSHFPHLDEDSRRVLQDQAFRAAQHLRISTAEGYAQQVAAGGEIDREQVQKDLAAGRLTRTQAAPLLKPAPKEFDSDQFASLMSRIAAYDPKKDVDKSTYAQLMQESAYGSLKGPAVTDLVEALKRQATPRGSLRNEGVTLAGKQIDQAFDNGFLGKWKVTIEPDPTAQLRGAKPKTLRNEAAWEKAVAEKARLYSQLNQYVRENPDAAPDEIASFVNRSMKARLSVSRARIFELPSAFPSAPSRLER